jgi:hypothetical protein
MTIEPDADAAPPQHDELVRFVFRAASAPPLLQRARALLAAAPAELSESFEQAVRASGLAS